MIVILHLAGQRDVQVPARVTHDPASGTTRLVVAWPDDGGRATVTGFTMTDTTGALTLESGDTLTIPLPPVTVVERMRSVELPGIPVTPAVTSAHDAMIEEEMYRHGISGETP